MEEITYNVLLNKLDKLKEELNIYKFQYNALIRQLDFFSCKLPENKSRELNKIFRDNYNNTIFYLDQFVYLNSKGE